MNEPEQRPNLDSPEKTSVSSIRLFSPESDVFGDDWPDWLRGLASSGFVMLLTDANGKDQVCVSSKTLIALGTFFTNKQKYEGRDIGEFAPVDDLNKLKVQARDDGRSCSITVVPVNDHENQELLDELDGLLTGFSYDKFARYASGELKNIAKRLQILSQSSGVRVTSVERKQESREKHPAVSHPNERSGQTPEQVILVWLVDNFLSKPNEDPTAPAMAFSVDSENPKEEKTVLKKFSPASKELPHSVNVEVLFSLIKDIFNPEVKLRLVANLLPDYSVHDLGDGNGKVLSWQDFQKCLLSIVTDDNTYNNSITDQSILNSIKRLYFQY